MRAHSSSQTWSIFICFSTFSIFVIILSAIPPHPLCPNSFRNLYFFFFLFIFLQLSSILSHLFFSSSPSSSSSSPFLLLFFSSFLLLHLLLLLLFFLFFFHSHTVCDVQWSPSHPAVFSTITSGGCLALWNLRYDVPSFPLIILFLSYSMFWGSSLV